MIKKCPICKKKISDDMTHFSEYLVSNYRMKKNKSEEHIYHMSKVNEIKKIQKFKYNWRNFMKKKDIDTYIDDNIRTKS
jgi:hypothetical protein